MKLISLLGGMSRESSIIYKRIINEEVRRRLGGVHSADLLIRSYDSAVVERLRSAGEWEQAGHLLGDGARKFEAAGAQSAGVELTPCTEPFSSWSGAVWRTG